MKQITTLFIALALAGAALAQSIKFQKTIGSTGTDYCWSVAHTSDGGYILAGETNSIGAGSYDAYLTKTDAYGAVQWTRAYGGTGWDGAYMVRETSDGGFIVVGLTESSGNGLGDMWIFKTTALGIISWQRTVGGANGDSGNDIIQTADGGYIAAGFQEDVSTSYNACLVKMDGSGSVQWIRTYSVGTDEDYAFSVAQTTDGGYVVGGENFDGISSKALVVKTDASGNVQWANTYGGVNDHWINGLVALSNGNCVVTGVSSQTSFIDIWLAELNPNGNPVWSNTYAGPGSGAENCLWLTTSQDGGYALCGRTNSFSADYEAFLLKTDATGAPEWSKRYGGTANDRANQVVKSSNGGYALACNSISFGSGESGYFIKTDTVGTTGCNENLPSFLMSNVSTPVANISVIDSSLTNVAASNILFTTQTLTETPLCFTLGENELAEAEDLISIYPNPATGRFTVYDLRSTIEGVEVYSSVGMKVFSQKPTADGPQQQMDIDVSEWSSGIYFVRIKTADGLRVEKFVRQ